jgi:hypothetical protein
MSNLSELLPAGGAGKNVSFVASGTLPNGQAVVLKADGTVEAVGESGATESIPAGSEAVFNAGSTVNTSVSFNPNVANQFVVAYTDNGNSQYGTAVIGTVSGTSLSFGSEVVYNSSQVAQSKISFDPNTSGKFVIAFNEGAANSTAGKVIVGTISGTSLSFGTKVAWNGTSATGWFSIEYDPNNAGHVAISYRDGGGSNHGKAIVGQISGTSISFGSEVTFNGSSTFYTGLSFDAGNSGTFVVTYGDAGNSSRGTAIIGTISSGTVISFGSEYVFNSSTTYYTNVAFDPSTAGVFVVTYTDAGNSSAATAEVGTVSGTSISFGSAVVFSTKPPLTSAPAFNQNKAGSFVIVYEDSSSPNGGYAIVGTVSGTSLSFGSEQVYNSGNTGSYSVAVDSNTLGKFVIIYNDGSNSNYGTGILGQLSTVATNLTTTNFVGMADAAIADTAEGSVTIKGGLAKSVANTQLLQLYGSEAVFNSGTSNYVSLSFDPNTTNKFVVVYRDNQNLNYGTACVGTISGNSISFGSEVVFNSGTTTYSQVSFDPNNAGKVVVAYGDGSAGSDGMAIVGTVSGTSISFGSEVVFNSGSTGYIYIDFDPSSSGKFVIAYQDASNSNYGTAIVGTVSGTSISYGSEVLFAAADTNVSAISFDANASGKFVIFYTDGGNSNYGTAIVGTLSGTSTSYGSEVVFNSAGSYNLSSEFDPNTANKIAFSFADAGNASKGTIIIGTVSGTSISFGSKFIFNSGGTSYTSISFDSNTSGRLVVAYRDSDNSNYGTSRVGTVSGTSISFGTVVIFNAGTTNYPSLSFDPNTANKYVIAYKDSGNSSYGTAIVGNLSDALTIGSDYYVQADGTVSTVTTSPAVKLGKALSTTSINLEFNT